MFAVDAYKILMVRAGCAARVNILVIRASLFDLKNLAVPEPVRVLKSELKDALLLNLSFLVFSTLDVVPTPQTAKGVFSPYLLWGY